MIRYAFYCSAAACAWLRLGAGCAMLKICEQQGVGDEYTVEQLYNLSILVTDELKEVRQTFLAKLQKGLARGVPIKVNYIRHDIMFNWTCLPSCSLSMVWIRSSGLSSLVTLGVIQKTEPKRDK